MVYLDGGFGFRVVYSWNFLGFFGGRLFMVFLVLYMVLGVLWEW